MATGSAQALLEATIQAVEASDSFRVEQDFNDDGEVDSIIEFEGIDNSHGWERADPGAASGAAWYETLTTPDWQFSRSCKTFEGCETWVRYPLTLLESDSSVYIGPVECPLGCRTGLAEVLQITQELGYVGDPSAGHLGGETNPVRAILECLQTELSGIFAPSVLESAKDSLGKDVAFYDANPAPIDIWASPDGYPTRIVLDQNAEHSQGTGKVDARFFRFNEVTITPPTDFIPLPTPTPNP